MIIEPIPLRRHPLILVPGRNEDKQMTFRGFARHDGGQTRFPSGKKVFQVQQVQVALFLLPMTPEAMLRKYGADLRVKERVRVARVPAGLIDPLVDQLIDGLTACGSRRQLLLGEGMSFPPIVTLEVGSLSRFSVPLVQFGRGPAHEVHPSLIGQFGAWIWSEQAEHSAFFCDGQTTFPEFKAQLGTSHHDVEDHNVFSS